jgi:hypothetical protein
MEDETGPAEFGAPPGDETPTPPPLQGTRITSTLQPLPAAEPEPSQETTPTITGMEMGSISGCIEELMDFDEMICISVGLEFRPRGENEGSDLPSHDR